MNRQSAVSLAVLTLLSAIPAAALAQSTGEAVPTSGGEGYVDPNARIAPAGQGPVVTVPAPKKTVYKGPLDRLADIPRNNFLSNLHGSVGVMVGTHNTRGAYVDVHGPIGDNAAFDLNFASVHSDALPYYNGAYGYGPGYGYGSVDGLSPRGGAFGGVGRGYGYGYGSGTSTTVGASLQLGGDNQNRYDRVWPNYRPPQEETDDVTDEPPSSSR